MNGLCPTIFSDLSIVITKGCRSFRKIEAPVELTEYAGIFWVCRIFCSPHMQHFVFSSTMTKIREPINLDVRRLSTTFQHSLLRSFRWWMLCLVVHLGFFNAKTFDFKRCILGCFVLKCKLKKTAFKHPNLMGCQIIIFENFWECGG